MIAAGKHGLIVHGDALETVQRLRPGSIDVTCTDPPYASGGLHVGAKAGTTTEKYFRKGDGSRELPAFGGDNVDQLTWVYQARAWYRACHRAAKQGGHLYTFVDWRQIGAAILAVQMGGWTYRGIVVWEKPTARGTHAALWTPGAEYVIWGTKGKPWSSSGGAWVKGHPCHQNVITCNPVPPKRRKHQTEKPVAVLRKILQVSCPPGGTVLDPFMGSGSTLEAAAREGMNAIGVEESAEYVEIARERLIAVDRDLKPENVS